MLVDTHVHVSQNWYEPVETLLFQMDRNAVGKAVLIQILTSYDNSYLLECVHRYPDRFAAAVLVDTQKADATDTLEKWARAGATGVRLQVNWRSPGPDPLAIWRKADELGLVVSGRGELEMFAADEFRTLIETLPNLKIVLEHLGYTGRPQAPAKYVEKVLALAKYPNIYVKLPALGELFPRPASSDVSPFSGPPPVVRLFYAAFGRQRLMWGSDFPLCLGREGYTSALRLPMERTPFFSEEDKAWIFGKTALSVWNLA